MPEQLASLLPPLPTGKGTKGYRISVWRFWLVVSSLIPRAAGLGSANAPALVSLLESPILQPLDVTIAW